MIRVAIAFLLAPGIGVVCGSAMAALMATALTTWGGFEYFVLLLLFGAFFAYPLACVLGIPAFFLLTRSLVESPWLLAAVGLLIGVVGWALGASPVVSSEYYLRAGIEAVFALVSATVGALAFWFIAVRKNPAVTQTPNLEDAP